MQNDYSVASDGINTAMIMGIRSLSLLFMLALGLEAHAFSRFVFAEGNNLRVEYQASQNDRRGVTRFESPAVERRYRARLSQLKMAMSSGEAHELMTFFLYSSPIPVYYVEDYCYARAHEMAQVLELMGIHSQKIIAEGDLQIRDAQGTLISWKYHIAPTVRIMINGRPQTRVIDLSLSEEPLTIEQWFGKMSPEPCVSKGRFEWYDQRAQRCVYYQVPRFYYQAQDLWQEYSDWRPEHLQDAYQKILELL